MTRPFTNGVEWGWKKCTDPMVGGARSIAVSLCEYMLYCMVLYVTVNDMYKYVYVYMCVSCGHPNGPRN